MGQMGFFSQFLLSLALLTMPLAVNADTTIVDDDNPYVDGYGECTSKNNYLEALFAKENTAINHGDLCPVLGKPVIEDLEDVAKIVKDIELPAACVLASLKRSGMQSKFIGCQSSTSGAIPRSVPCISKNYHLAMYTGFMEAMACLKGSDPNGFDVKNFFAIINHESSFHINVQSPTGAIGPGQLTPPSINSVNSKNYAAAYNELLTRKECAPIKKILEKKAEVNMPCNLVGYPENPIRNFIYSGLTYNVGKKEAAKLVEHKIFKEEDRDAIAQELARYMYNGGIGGVTSVFKAQYVYHFGTKKVDFETFKKTFPQVAAKHYGDGFKEFDESDPAKKKNKQGRQKEVANYSRNIDRDLAELKPLHNAKCY
jgi:hypothetical protein